MQFLEWEDCRIERQAISRFGTLHVRRVETAHDDVFVLFVVGNLDPDSFKLPELRAFNIDNKIESGGCHVPSFLVKAWVGVDLKVESGEAKEDPRRLVMGFGKSDMLGVATDTGAPVVERRFAVASNVDEVWVFC